DAVAELIRSRIGAGRVHLVGYSLGSQVGVQLLATEPELVDRAAGTLLTMVPHSTARSMQFLAERLARMRSFRRLINRLLTARQVPIPKAKIHDYRQ
ncbi:hypothetical protein C6A85_69420, partial [Mycobacterium sp. ITM-2017-0098]